MFLSDIAQFSINRDQSSMNVEQKLTSRLRQLGYISYKGNVRTGDIEKILINIANTEPEKLKKIGEPLVYKFMDRER